jgi:membrane-anchored mycosin MYCP
MADQSLPAFRDADWSASDELIVATEHLDFVRDLIGSRIDKECGNRRLGLTRLTFTSAAEAISDLAAVIARTPRGEDVRQGLLAHAAAVSPQTALVSTQTTSEGERDDRIATIATDLRAVAIARYGGWMPTIGRNRYVLFPGTDPIGITGETSFGVQAKGETSFGGGGLPRPLTGARKKWSSPASRATGPGTGVRVGVLDTRIWRHPWLESSLVVRPSDVLPDSERLGPVAGHATFVGGLILSQAPGASLLARRVLDDDGQGTAWDVAEAIVELGRSAVAVLNLSFACYTADGQPPLVLARAVDRLDPDVVVVAAAGNHADLERISPAKEAAYFASLPSWPAALDGVVAVGALDAAGQRARFSPERPWVDVAARGTFLRSTYVPRVDAGPYGVGFGAGWAEWSGTSFSAALVSGAIAAGVDPGCRSAADAVEDLLTRAAMAETAQAVGGGAGGATPRRLDLRTAGWARGSKPLRR